MAEIEPIGLSIQTYGIEKGIQKLDELAAMGPVVEKAMDDVADSGKRVAKSLQEMRGGTGDGLKQTADAAQRTAYGLRSVVSATGAAAKESDALRQSVESITKSDEKYLRGLLTQYNALTMTRGEFAAYKAAQSGLSGSAQNVAKALTEKIDALKAEKQAIAEAEKANKSYSDTVSGVSTAIKSLVSLAALTMVFKKFASETIAAEQEQAQLAAVLKSTGEAAGWTQDKLNDMAASMSKNSVFSAGQINQAQTRMLSYSNVVGMQFPKAMQATIDMAQRMGMSVTQSAETIGKALDVPSEGLTALTKQGFRFTEAQKLMVKQLEDTGKTAEAQDIILSALESSYGGAAEAARNTLGGSLSGLKNTINDLMTGSGGSVDGLTGSVNELSRTLGSDEVKQAFGALTNLMANALTVATRLADALAKLGVGNVGGALLDGKALNNPESALVDVEARIGRIKRDMAAYDPNATGWKGARNKINSIFWDDYEDSLLQLSVANKQRDELLKKVGGEQYGDNAPDASLWNPDPVKAYGKALAENTAWIKQYGTAAQKAAQEIKEWEKKLGEPLSDSMKAQIEKKYADKAVNKKGIAEANKELKEQQKLVSEMVGLKPDFMDDWNRLNKLYGDGKISLEELTRWQKKLLEQQPFFKAQTKDVDEADKAYRKYIDTLGKTADSIEDQALNQDAANASFGKSKVAIAELAMEQAKLAAASAKDVGPWTQEQVDKLTKIAAAHEHYVQSLKEATYLEFGTKYDEQLKVAKEAMELQEYGMSLLGVEETKRQKLIAAKQSELKLQKEIRAIEKESYSDNPVQDWIRKQDLIAKARLNAETELQTELLRIQEQSVNEQVQKYDQIFSQGFADMLNRGKDGWKSFTKSLTTTFKTTVADEIYKMFARPFVVQIVASLMGVAGGGAGGAAMQAASGVGSLLNLAGNASSLWGAVSGGLNGAGAAGKWLATSEWTSLGGEAVQQMLGEFGAGMMNTASWSAASTAAAAGGSQLAGMLVGSALNGLTGYSLSKWISGGYSAGSWVNTVAGIASAIPGIGPIAGVIGGVINRAFGRKLKDAGIEGEFGGDTGFEGRKYEFYKGGWFRSDKTKYSELDEQTRKGFADQFTGYKDSIEAMGESLGLGANLLDGFTHKVKISLKGLSDEDAAKKIKEEFDKLGIAMASVVLTTDEYAKEEETRLQTLARLAQSLSTVNEWLKVTGNQLLAVGVAGADMASQLIDAFGGGDQFNSVTSSYYDKYFTDSQKIDAIIMQMSGAMKELGYDSIPATREAMMALVNAQDLTTEEGRKAYAALMGVANILDTVYSAADQLASLNFDLNVELLRAQGRETEAIALEREKRIKELLQYGDAVVDKQRKIWAEQDKRAEEEAKKKAAEELAASTKKALEDAQNKAMRNLEAATDRELKALASRKDFLNEQRNLANESLGLINGIFELVRDNARELYGSIESVAQMQASQGLAFIDQALSAALSTGYLPEREQLTQAIAAARSGLDNGAFASQIDKDYNTLVLAGKLSALESVSGKQKTVAEQQLESLDRQIAVIDKQSKYLQDQLSQIKDLVSIAKGEYDATISVEQAVRDVYRLFDLKSKPPTTTPTPGKGSGREEVVGGGDYGPSTPPPGLGDRSSDGGYFREINLPTGTFFQPTSAEDTAHLNEVDKWLDKYRGTGDVEGMLRAASDAGSISIRDITTVMGWTGKDLENIADKLGIPRFSVGTNFVPSDMLAQIHKGERIIPAADNRALMAAIDGGTTSRTDRLEALVEKLIERTEVIGGEQARLNLRVARVVERWDGGGMPVAREEAKA